MAQRQQESFRIPAFQACIEHIRRQSGIFPVHPYGHFIKGLCSAHFFLRS
jgi:hypothetical protein